MSHESQTSLAPGAATLAAAVTAVSRVAHEGRSADAALQEAESRPDRAAVRAIALGTMRWYLRLAPALGSLVTRPAAEMEPLLRALLITAAHQIEYSRGAPEVSVHLAVDAARALGLARATGFVNAVLRRFVRERAALLVNTDADLATRTAHPEWLVRRLAEAWPAHCEAILEANNRHPPMVLRVADSADASRADYLRELAAAGRTARPIEWLPQAIELEHSMAVNALPGFRDGRVSVQDSAAQLAAELLAAQRGQRVLDACAAPGGKTAHILQREPGVTLLSVDADAERLAMVTSTLARIGLRADCRVADLLQPEALADLPLFEKILLDAPCSATGVIRRHPDIKLLRREADIAGFSRVQRQILRNVFARLAPGGRLVYATCSVLPEENEAVVLEFLASEPAARVLPWPNEVAMPPGALRLEAGVQLLPGAQAGSDGFYYACLGRGSGA